jgi:hypothetical protein
MLLASLIEQLKQTDNIQYLARLHLFFARINDRMTRSYEHLISLFEREARSGAPAGSYLSYGSSKAVRTREWPQRYRRRQSQPRNGDCEDDEADEEDEEGGDEDSNGHPPSEATNGSDSSRAETASSQQQDGGRKYSCGTGADEQWDWRSFPGPLPKTKSYTRFTTGWVIYACIRSLFLDQLGQLVGLVSVRWIGCPGHCLLMGRLVLMPAVAHTSSIIFGGFHVIWRKFLQPRRGPYRLTMLTYLLHSSADVERFLRLMERRQAIDRGPGGPHERANTGQQQQVGQHHQTVGPLFHCDRESRAVAGATPARRAPPPPLSLNEFVLRHVMCFKIKHDNRVYYKLRPNRTPEARSLLCEQVAKSFVLATVAFAFLACFAVTYSILVIISNGRYLEHYSGCFRELDELHARRALPYSSITLRDHHLVSGVVDLVENVVIWFEGCFAMLYVPTLAYLLNYDLLLYWTALQSKMERLLERARLGNAMQASLMQAELGGGGQQGGGGAPTTATCEPAPADDEDEHPPPPPAGELAGGFGTILRRQVVGRSTNRPRLVWRCVQATHRRQQRQHHAGSLSNNELSARSPVLDSLDRFCQQLDFDIHEIQFEIVDFFHEVGWVDLLVSDIITLAVFVWLATCAMIGHNFLSQSRPSIPLVIEFFLVLGFIIMTGFAHSLLRLRRCCLRSYRTICSLMAYDRTAHKKRFIRMMDFYTQLNRASYTLARSYPFKPTTFITIIGYSLSCFFIAVTLFGRRHHKHQNELANSPDTQRGQRDGTGGGTGAAAQNIYEYILRLGIDY